MGAGVPRVRHEAAGCRESRACSRLGLPWKEAKSTSQVRHTLGTGKEGVFSEQVSVGQTTELRASRPTNKGFVGCARAGSFSAAAVMVMMAENHDTFAQTLELSRGHEES